METGINQYLNQFNAGFRISNVDTSHERGFPRIKYQLQLRDQNIELGSSDDAQKKPVFSNTLSEGDKRTLAFSFFLAKNNLDPKINEKIIVVDDPMSSLDQSRQFTTQMALKELSEKGKQLIVLSHDPRFLQSFLENGFFHSEDFVTLELTRSSNDYTIMKECNLDDCIQTGYKKNYRTVSDYVLQGQCRDKVLVVRSIRPMVEATLRYRYLDSLKGAESLGKMIGIIEQSQSDSPLFRARSILPKLKEINVYTAGHTHDTSADDSLQQITDSELTRYSKIALNLAQGE
jgi:wobble nucleotide-excising tRNase